MIENISVVIIVKNGAKTIQKTLHSVRGFADVVVYDNGSTDDTLAIVKKYQNINLIQGDFLGFGATKNKATVYAKNNWILSLDADEVIESELLDYLAKITLDKTCVYSLLRKSFYQNTHIKYCWKNDVIVRLFHRKTTSFTNSRVHEKIRIESFTVQPLSGFINHYPYNSISDFIVKLDVYSSEFAKDNVGKKSSSPLKAISNASFSFFKTYILKQGFLDGYAGLVIAFSHMATNFYKYIKLYELNKKK